MMPRYKLNLIYKEIKKAQHKNLKSDKLNTHLTRKGTLKHIKRKITAERYLVLKLSIKRKRTTALMRSEMYCLNTPDS